MIGRVSFVVNDGKPAATRLQEELAGLLEEAGVEVGDDRPDLVVSLGGDGTMLRAARVAHRVDAPLMGINLGTLGYLTEVQAEEAVQSLSAVLSGSYSLEERIMLVCGAPGLRSDQTHIGLNEVLVERAEGHRMVRLKVAIGGESLASFNADGVIVATPTGSTAYALSAGGPIVSPNTRCLVVVPVSAHMIFSRPFVIPDDEQVEIIVEGERARASVSLDGTGGAALNPGETVSVRRHPRALKLVRLQGPGFVERLRTKLGLPS
jgi:NAD+ kinase